MSNTRLTRRVFDWDYTTHVNTWCSEIGCLLSSIKMYDIFVNKHVCNINHVHERLRLRHSSRWLESMQSKPELRTYATFKKEYETETFIEINLTSQRSYMAQFRCGILPLRMETGRFVGEEIEDRVCNLRNKNKIVDGLHFVL